MLRKKTKNKEYQSWHGFLFLAVLFVALILGIMQRLSS